MAEAETVKAVWAGPFPCELPGVGAIIYPGDVAEVSKADLASAHWASLRSQAGQAAREQRTDD
jgi:hypothetical protein